MEEEKLDLQVGDRVTFENLEGNVVIMLIKNNAEIPEILDTLKARKILKIERPHYEVIEEKKELLTEEERKFLNHFIKSMEYYSNNIWEIKFDEESIDFYGFSGVRLVSVDYPSILTFNTVKLGKYSVQELGLEES